MSKTVKVARKPQADIGPGDRVTCSFSAALAAGDGWVKYEANLQVREGESPEDASARVIRVTRAGTLEAADALIEMLSEE